MEEDFLRGLGLEMNSLICIVLFLEPLPNCNEEDEGGRRRENIPTTTFFVAKDATTSTLMGDGSYCENHTNQSHNIARITTLTSSDSGESPAQRASSAILGGSFKCKLEERKFGDSKVRTNSKLRSSKNDCKGGSEKRQCGDVCPGARLEPTMYKRGRVERTTDRTVGLPMSAYNIA